MQRARYDNLCAAIEETRQIRHDIRHHWLQLASLAENGDLEKIKEYLSSADSKMPGFDLHFCDNQAVDSVLGYYSAHAKQEGVPFLAKIDLPKQLPADEMDVCLVLFKSSGKCSGYQSEDRAFQEKDYGGNVSASYPSSFDPGRKIPSMRKFGRKMRSSSLQSVPETGLNPVCTPHCRKNGGADSFIYKNGIFTAKIMLRI